MAGWQGAEEFKSRAGGKGEQVPCMAKLFGIEGCPHCATAAAFFDADKEKEGRQAYWKKNLYGLVIMSECPDKNKANKILLMNFPVKQVEAVLKHVQDDDADTRWPTPTDLNDGRLLVLSKSKGQGEYPEYSINMVDRPMPLDANWWAQTCPQLVHVDNDLALLRAVKSYGPANMFSPSQDLKEGEKAKFRLLPIPGNEAKVPFGCLFTHYIPALTDWDKAWADVGYDPAKVNEVRAKLGLSTAAPAADAGGGFPGGGFPGAAPAAPGNQPW